jgi:hypothetical protein
MVLSIDPSDHSLNENKHYFCPSDADKLLAQDEKTASADIKENDEMECEDVVSLKIGDSIEAQDTGL